MTMAAEIVPYQQRVDTITDVLKRNNKGITSLLPAHVKPEMLMRTVFTAVTQTPKLLECTPVSILRCTLQAAMLGLPPNDGRGLSYLVPFKRNVKIDGRWEKISECQLITGYRGRLLLARQSGEVRAIDAGVVHEGDVWDYEKGLAPRLIHRKSKEPAYEPNGSTLRRKIVAAWCCASVSGERQFEALEWWEIERIRNGSQGYQYAIKFDGDSPWINHPGAMSMKTAVNAECKLLPLSSERLALAQRIDDAHDMGQAQPFEFGEVQIIDSEAGEAEKPPATDADGLVAGMGKGKGKPKANGNDAPADRCDGKHVVSAAGCGAPDCKRVTREPGDEG
jgi:recombination protein RecT